MDMYYETKRLRLQLLTDDYAQDVLDFYQRNKAAFEPWEPDRPQEFYTLDYQQALLQCELQLALEQRMLRFWISPRENPRQLIGTVSFQDIQRSVYQCCHIGYKIDPAFQHQGFAQEGVAKALEVVFTELNLHRVEALVLPENLPSIQLLEQLGFVSEGISHSCILLHGQWTDHARYSLIKA